MLDIVFIDEGEDLILDGGEVRHLRDGRPLVVVFVQQRYD